MNLISIGINHHIAPLEVREKVALVPEIMPDALQDLQKYLSQSQAKDKSEVAILSTCNRTEIYCAANDQIITDQQVTDKTIDWLSQQKGFQSDELTPYLNTSIASDAVRHVFRVGCGLDSMVLGETQILGQMKQAVQTAKQVGSMGTYLNQLFNKTFSVAKEVRTNTEINMHAISLASAALRLSTLVLGDVAEQRILFIGAGEMIQLCAAHFAAKNPKSITIANRSLERGELLAGYLRDQGRVSESIQLVELPSKLHQFDIVISCTASSLPIIGMGMVKTALKKRIRKPLVMIDLAVPRDIESEVSSLPDVYLYTVDNLGEVVKEGLGHRLSAVKSAEQIIDQQVSQFMQWLSQRAAVPLITSIKERSEAFQKLELEKAQKRLARGENPQEVMAELARALANKFLHGSFHLLHHQDEETFKDSERMLSQIYMMDHFRR